MKSKEEIKKMNKNVEAYYTSTKPKISVGNWIICFIFLSTQVICEGTLIKNIPIIWLKLGLLGLSVSRDNIYYIW